MTETQAYSMDFSKWDEIKRNTVKLDDFFTKVGIISGEMKEQYSDSSRSSIEVTDKTLAEVMAILEFGTSDGKIPSRPAFRNALKSVRPRLVGLIPGLVLRVQLGKMTPKQALSVIGEMVTNEIQEEIVELDSPGNAPSTIKRKKGQDNPLIDTGQLRQSITHSEGKIL